MMASTGRFGYNFGPDGLDKDDKRARDPTKTLVHPMQEQWVNICKKKEHYNRVFGPALAAAQQHYRKSSDNGIPGGRLDLGAMLDDANNGKLPSDMQDAFVAFKEARMMLQGKIKPVEKLFGTELSPAKRPMRPSLQPVVHKISDLKRNEVVVSRDVWGQLTQDQAEELTQNPGIHQCCLISTSKVSEANPTGVWPEFEKDLGDKVVTQDNGAIRKVYSFAATVKAKVRLIVPEPLKFTSPKMYEDFGIPEGTPISVTHTGVKRLDSADGIPSFRMKNIQKRLQKFRFSDPVGRHLDDITITGDICRKWDGVFHYGIVEDGRLEIRARNGYTYRGIDVDCCNIEFAFEQNSGAAKILYVRYLDKNVLPLCGPVHEYFNSRLKLEITGDLDANTELEFDWQFDGWVIKNVAGHHFIKATKTVDICEAQAIRLRKEGYHVAQFAPDYVGQIWELNITSRGLTGARIRKRMTKITGEEEVDKVLPNTTIRVKYAMAAPDWNAYKRHHKM